ncbi:hypothetical protein LCGC14_0515280 [marine sediment metagenome]|uniref:DUF4258 domain-containing protein n=1 Tax=marine sediment metagenome TaxID=412755 RepID=A0A0F9ULI5_9ZZZZ
MPIKFTKHALERMKIRGITKEDILDAVNNPEKELTDSLGNKVAHKVKKKYLLRVFYYSEKDSRIVITAYKTSKIDKNF